MLLNSKMKQIWTMKLELLFIREGFMICLPGIIIIMTILIMVMCSVRSCALVYTVISEFFLSRYPFPLCNNLPCIIFSTTPSSSSVFIFCYYFFLYICAFSSFLDLYRWTALSMSMRSDDRTGR